MRSILRTVWLAALLLLPLGGLAAPGRSAHAQTAGAFASVPVFNAGGMAFAVFGGGSVGQLETAADRTGASGIWAQDSGGADRLLVVNGPAFLKAPFTAAFPGGFGGAIAVTLVRPAVPSPAAAPAPAPAPAPTTFDAAVAQLVLAGTNEQRAARGLGALEGNSLLNASAAAYARVVFDRDPYLSDPASAHTLDGQPWDRATRAGYRWAGFAENVWSASATTAPSAASAAQRAVEGWMASPPHRENILTAAYVDTGVGCASGRPASVRPNLGFALICVAVYATPR